MLYVSDLYTFDKDISSAESTYNEVCTAYGKLFERLGLLYCKGKNIYI